MRKTSFDKKRLIGVIACFAAVVVLIAAGIVIPLAVNGAHSTRATISLLSNIDGKIFFEWRGFLVRTEIRNGEVVWYCKTPGGLTGEICVPEGTVYIVQTIDE